MARRRKGRGGNGSELLTKWTARVVLFGPPGSEEDVRNEFEQRLQERDLLGNCTYNPRGASFEESGHTAKMAFQIAWKVPFIETSEGSETRIVMKRLDVIYCNPPGPWKVWIQVRDGMQVGMLGDLA